MYKTTDGGKTWKAVPSISENTGVADVVIDPSSPDIVYAASWQRRRHIYTLINGGPKSAIHKSTDGGATWTRLRGGYLRLQANTEPEAARARLRLREWQAGRLARTHAVLLASPRFGQAAQFFLSDLYGPKDFSSRDEEVERILPLLIKMLPASALRTIALAVELDALSEELDSAMIAELCRAGLIDCIDEDAYAAAYRVVGCQAERERQILLIRETGEALDRLPGSRC